MKCTYCGYENEDTSKYCCMCGAKLEAFESMQTNTQIDKSTGYIPINREVEDSVPSPSGYVPIRKRKYEKEEILFQEPELGKEKLGKTLIVIAIVSILTFGLCMFLNQSMESLTAVSYDPTTYDYQSALQGEGMICGDEEYVYLSMQGSIYQYDSDMNEVDLLVNEYGESMFVYKNNLYYVNDNNDCYAYSLEDGTKELVLENVYYVSNLDNIITYQHDSDNESIHQYNIETKEDKKINDEVSYRITVLKDTIYYVDIANNLVSIKDGESTVIATYAGNMNVYNDELYFVTGTGIMKYNPEVAIEEVVSATYVDDFLFMEGKLFFNDYAGALYSVEGNETVSHQESGVTDIEVLGNLLFYYDENDGSYYVCDKEGYATALYQGEEHSYYKEGTDLDFEWEGVEQF